MKFSKYISLWPILVLTILFVFAYQAMLPTGMFYAHDSVFHVIRLEHFYNALVSGQFPVRWANDLAWGYGYPNFNFVYPLLYYLSSGLHFLGLPLTESLKLVVFLSSLFSVYFSYFFLRKKFSIFAAFVGACIYLFVPFRFLTTFVTGQFALALSFLWLPMIFYYLEVYFDDKGRKKLSLVMISITGALILLTHPISSLVFAPIIGAFLVYKIWEKKWNRRVWLPLVFGLGVSLLLSSFYTLPLLLESQYIKAGSVPAVVYSDHFATLKQIIYSKWGYGYSGGGEENFGISVQLGIAQGIVLVLTIGLVLVGFYRKKIDGMVLIMLGYLLFCIFMMMSWSDLIWRLPYMGKVEHPWRFLLGVMFACSYLSGWVVNQAQEYKKGLGLMVGVALVMISVWTTRNYLRPMEDARYQDDHYLESREFNLTGDVSMESLPIWVKGFPGGFADALVESRSKINSEVIYTRGSEYEIKTQSENGDLATINKLYFPMWKLLVDGEQVEIKPNPNGLIEFYLPAGEHRLNLATYNTRVEMIANTLSLVGIVLLIGFVFRSSKR